MWWRSWLLFLFHLASDIVVAGLLKRAKWAVVVDLGRVASQGWVSWVVFSFYVFMWTG